SQRDAAGRLLACRGSPGSDGPVTDDTSAPPGRPRCPTCDRPVAWAANPNRHFCSLTCTLLDLGKWLDQRYRVPGPPLAVSDAVSDSAVLPASADAPVDRD